MAEIILTWTHILFILVVFFLSEYQKRGAFSCSLLFVWELESVNPGSLKEGGGKPGGRRDDEIRWGMLYFCGCSYCTPPPLNFVWSQI